MVGHDCDAPATVEVKQDDREFAGIPIIDEGITVHERKDGPIDMSRRAEVTFPITSGEDNWYEYIDAYQQEGSVQEAKVSMKPINSDGDIVDDEVLLMRGYIGAVGSRGAVNKGHITIFGPYNFLSEIHVGNTFDSATPASEIFKWAIEEYERGQPIFDNVRLETEGIDRMPGRPEPEGEVKSRTTGDIPVPGKHKWSAARDTLADVLQYLGELVEATIWFEPDPDGGLILKAVRDPGQSYDATKGGDMDVIFNNALYELRPFNAVRLKGTGNHVLDLGDFGEINTQLGNDGNYYEGEAWYQPLVERSGGKIWKEGTSQMGTGPAVKANARKELKKTLDDVSGGTMDVALFPHVLPFDNVTAKPACASIIDEDVPELKYEVQRTAHTLAPHDPGNEPEIPSTEIAVSLSVDPDKIQSRADEKRTMTSEESENEPYDSEPSADKFWDFAP